MCESESECVCVCVAGQGECPSFHLDAPTQPTAQTRREGRPLRAAAEGVGGEGGRESAGRGRGVVSARGFLSKLLAVILRLLGFTLPPQPPPRPKVPRILKQTNNPKPVPFSLQYK